ncbi:hypothetical protein GCM10017764_03650 [Sphingobacterium griseoflavum]|uniref:Uncharacterized protein n=2 Tax=Sphingobacterium griseoflavum TaxID=1474952 RepID=A0ABQ3HV90_9SPHI|nr:hypothetical protein GCM10017764_03650 [Sphingobacterium griseoflavum]
MTDNLPVQDLSIEEQIKTDGGGDRNDEKQGSIWDKILGIFVG